MCAYTDAQTHMHTHKITHSIKQIHLHMHTHMHVHTHVHTHTHSHIHTHAHAHTHTHTHTHMYTHTHVYTHAHTHTIHSNNLKMLYVLSVIPCTIVVAMVSTSVNPLVQYIWNLLILLKSLISHKTKPYGCALNG